MLGDAGEWAGTAAWLTGRYRVATLDAGSPGDVASRIEAQGLAPAVLIGHGAGGHMASLVAAGHPELVCGLVIAEATAPYGPEWESIRCPTLIVRAGKGDIAAGTAVGMKRRLPHAELVNMIGAGHDVHLDQPEEWRAVVSGFLDRACD